LNHADEGFQHLFIMINCLKIKQTNQVFLSTVCALGSHVNRRCQRKSKSCQI